MIADLINALVYYAKLNLNLLEEDEIFITNILFGILKEENSNKNIKIDTEKIKKMSTPDDIIDKIVDYGEQKLGVKNRELFSALIMGIVTPTPSSVIRKFEEIEKENGINRALDYFYNLCIKSDYIKKSAIDKNIFFSGNEKDKRLDMTINLSKPEKDNKEIAKNVNEVVNNDFPKCMLCKENIGYFGRGDFPARQTLRYIPLTLNGEKWYMHYSPYAYYNHHSIIFSDEHIPMETDVNIVKRFFDFLDRFNCYFIGSNACLPIVGGSILNHAHFQGGKYDMPLFSAKAKYEYKATNFKSVKVYYLDWFCNTLLLESEDRQEIEKLANKIIDKYNNYDDDSIDLISKTTENHNAVTMISKKDGKKYKLFIIFRNNRTNKEYPDGIFHAHEECHNIKKEGIGMIEALGLFVLPPRLFREFNEINAILTSENNFDISQITKEHSLYIHKDMISKLMTIKDENLNKEEADILIKNYALKTCANILNDISVFKNTSRGKEALDKFLKQLDILEGV